MLDLPFLNNYKTGGFEKIDGWCGDKLFDIVNLLNSVGINKEGGCLEIGVHHGKFYILLNGVIDRIFKSYAVDLFENQQLNIDGSGRGSLEAFRGNLRKYDRHKGANTEIISADSTDPKAIKFIRDAAGPLRFISVDGGHTPEHTVSDLRLATKLLANEGVVILDDIFNYHWPGVVEGAVTFLREKPTLVPFAIGHNKLLLSKLSYRSYYFNLFNKSALKSKVVNFFSYPLVAL